jgi:hypothetical protein
MPLCQCILCLASTDGHGKEVHASTIKRHMDRDRIE